MNTSSADPTRSRLSRSRQSRSRFSAFVASALALALIAGACSNDNDDEGFFEDRTETTVGRSAAEDDSGSDAEGDFAPAPTEERDDGDSDAMEEAEAPSADEVSGGFFAAEESADDAEADLARREENNVFQDYGVRSFIETSRDPLSTFAMDVDTASYSIGRTFLREGVVPPPESVRVEEYVNSFHYDYPAPGDGLTVVAEGGPSPFDSNNVIVRLGVQAEEVRDRDRPDASLTFVIDTSGSMDRDGRIDLVKTSLTNLVRELDRDDRVAIVTFGNQARVVLEPTWVSDEDEILDAIDGLRTGGSTNVEAGLRLGYDLADEAFRSGEINRVILASDGVANAGLTDPDGLARMIRDDADRGVQLISVGVGMGNFNDVVLETLADDGDGFYRYVNTEQEAAQLFGDDLVSSLLTVAIDGKIQVEFDDRHVRAYRLLGFENRAVRDDDFRNDAVDAGELGAGHQVTALYELELWDDVDAGDRLGTAQLRWEDPESGDVIETRLELSSSIIEERWSDTSDDFRLAVIVGAFAEKLRLSQYAEDVSLDQIAAEADSLDDQTDAVRELADLIRDADRLS